MSVEQYDTAIIHDRKDLEKLSEKQLHSLLPFPKKELKKISYTKDNLIEMILNQFV